MFNFIEVSGLRLSGLGRVPKSALVVGAIAGLISIAPGAAKAQSSCSFGGAGALGTVCGTDISTLDVGDKRLTFLPGLNFGGAKGNVNFNFIPGPDLYTVNVDFNPDGSSLNTSGTVPYQLDILPGSGSVFDTVKLTDNSINPVTSITKQVAYDGKTLTQISVNGVTVGPDKIGGTSILVTDSWVNNGTGVLDSFTNTYKQASSVPGPVPLLGAGAAFGFSRRMRRRLKGVSLA